LKILNNLKHATDRLQMPSSPQVVKWRNGETHKKHRYFFYKFESYLL
jgi:hypothetical protein